MVPGIVILWAFAVAALFLGARRWVSAASALGIATVLFLAVELGLLYLNPVTGLGMPVLDVTVWGAVILGSVVWLALRRVPAPTARGWWLGAAAASGSLVVIATMALAQVIPGATRLAWAMNSDAVNVLTFSRDILAAGGLASAPTAQDTSPTPLPFGMLAVSMSPGRGTAAGAALAEHDVIRLAQLWIFMIALACLLAGVIVAKGAERARLRVAIPATVLVSLLMLTWYVIGVQFEYGFLSSAFAAVVLLAAWLVYLGGQTRPALSLAVLLLAATVVLAVWSPLIIVIAALGVVIVVTSWRRILASGPGQLAAVGLGCLVLIAYAALVTVPEYLAKSSFLGANGGFPAFGWSQVLTVLVVTALLSALGARVLGLRYQPTGAIAATVAGAIGLAFLLAQRTGAQSGWGYYPAKYGWTITILLLVISASAAAGLLVNFTPKRGWDVAVAVLSVAVLGSLWLSPVQPSAQLPLVSVLKGTSGPMSQAAADLIFDNSGRENGQNFFWRSTIGDSWMNLWLLQLDVDNNHHNPVRDFAYQTTTFTPAEACQVIDLLGSEVVVHTADSSAEAELAAACPGRDYTVTLGAY